jgi:hypothetical protein
MFALHGRLPSGEVGPQNRSVGADWVYRQDRVHTRGILPQIGFRAIPGYMYERREKRKRWIQRGDYAVEVEVEVVYPVDDPSEPCLEAGTVRWLDEVARKAAEGDLAYLKNRAAFFSLYRPERRSF